MWCWRVGLSSFLAVRYLAISPDATPMEWTQGVTYAHNGTEFAFMACAYGEADPTQAISGMGHPIECKI